MSKTFSQVMSMLSVKHWVSSAFHPESQGTLEQFHQTLKSMLRKFCVGTNREWDEGLLLLPFAIRETAQESLGFSLAELVFGHTVRGPLRLLQESWQTSAALCTTCWTMSVHSGRGCDLARTAALHSLK